MFPLVEQKKDCRKIEQMLSLCEKMERDRMTTFVNVHVGKTQIVKNDYQHFKKNRYSSIFLRMVL